MEIDLEIIEREQNETTSSTVLSASFEKLKLRRTEQGS